MVNGVEIPNFPQIKLSNPVVDMLENLLRDAKAGAIDTIAVIVSPPTGGAAVMSVGGRVLDILGGTVVLQHKVLTESVKAQQGRPAIIPVRG